MRGAVVRVLGEGWQSVCASQAPLSPIAQDGSLDLNAAESGVQHKPAQRGVSLTENTQTADASGCSC